MYTRLIDLEHIDTKDLKTGRVNGRFIPVWRNWDSYMQVEPGMVYMTAANPGEIKGPHLHKERWGYLTCLKGRVVFVIKNRLEDVCEKQPYIYEEIILDAAKPQVLEIPPNVPQAHVNISSCEAILINLCSPAWHPNNQDNYNDNYDDYDFSKWTTKINTDREVKE